MRRETLWQSRLPTPLPKLVGEARRCEGLAVIRHQESQMLALRNRQALMQFVVNWNCDLDARLLLLNCQNPVTDVLLSHPHHITTTLSCVKQ
jgi:hypothetical protein